MIVDPMEGSARNRPTARDRPGGPGTPTVATSVVRLRDITLAGALEEVELGLAAALAERPSTIAVDMSSVGQLSSTTVAALLWIRRCSKARGVEVALRNASPGVLDRLQRAGVLGFMEIEPPHAAGRGPDPSPPPGPS